MIIFDNVTKIYDNGVKALDNVSFVINKGEFVFVVGPSGAGKSSIIKLLLREEILTDGKIIVNNTDVTDLRRKEVCILRRSMGIVFQDFKLLLNKTVFENVSFAMEIIGTPKRMIRRRVPELLSLVGLTHKAKAYPNQLSGGEQQRVSLARALANNPEILIADEPTGNLNPKTSVEIMELLDDINKRGTTIIMATHAKDIVDSMKKRVIAIEDGLLVRDEARGVYGYEV